ncbi:MAG TPA: transcriptional regulator [Ruminiclostridium sp.]|nr:transcriptional regulator [Ruminiclostridium sp.]
MVFSSITFLYFFLPVVLVLYFITPNKFKNYILLIASLFFYFCGEPKYTLLLIASITINYFYGILIEKHRGAKIAKCAVVSSIIANLLLLVVFKYSNFLISNISYIFNIDIKFVKIALPIGISFYTFQAMSYVIDVYRGEVKAQKNVFNLALYISLFPQLIAGPIVRYKTINNELTHRNHSFDDFAYGVKRFVVGLAKKVLLANALGEIWKLAMYTEQPSVLFYWLGAVGFTLQIYFDFSAYSDMAIGLGRILGFHFLENFNYPYISKSITEFWRRWHISLGTWFRDYLYIPLGGNKTTKCKWLRNIFIVWFCTGFWHGADWNFIIWGTGFGVILAAEKLFLLNFLKKVPPVFSHVYTLAIIIFSFVVFNSSNIADAAQYMKGMVGLLNIPVFSKEALYYLGSYKVLIILAALCSTPIPLHIAKRISKNCKLLPVVNYLEPIIYIALLIVVTGFLIDSSFNPFLYFRF